MIIRPEKQEEFDAISDLIKTAFTSAKVSNGKEQEYVTQWRASAAYIPGLALVAEDDHQLLGHIMLTRAAVADGEQSHEVLLLAPVSVIEPRRSQGIGAALIDECLRRAQALGFSAVLLFGDPAYYHRFGFQSASAFGIKFAHDVPDEVFMVKELTPGALRDVHGLYDFSE